MCCVRILILLFISVCTLRAQNPAYQIAYGLAFASHETTKDHRTALNLNPEKPFTFNTDFEVSADLGFQRLINAYGYIVRIVANDSLNIDLVSSPDHHDFGDLNVIINNEPTNLRFMFPDVGLKAQQWTKLILSFSRAHNTLSLSWNGQTKTQALNLDKLTQFRFLFGANDFGKFNTSDAPPIMLRNIALYENHKIAYKWILQHHRHNEVYDSIHHALATVTNPTWLIDNHTRFVHRKTFSIGRFPSITYNADSGILYAIDKNKFYSYNLTSETVKETRYGGGNPIYTDANQLLYIPEKKLFVNYDVHTRLFQLFDPKNPVWPNRDTTYNEPNYWHNNKFYNPYDSSFYTFGGYGFFTYKGELHKHQLKGTNWDVKANIGIPPRYLGATGLRASSHEMLFFGGYGSASGKQELSPQSFYDLYSFDLKTQNVKKLWEFNDPSTEDLVFSNSLVVNELNDGFYVLAFPKNKFQNSIRLREYGLSQPNMKVFADSIPFKFHDENSFCDLFLSAKTNELVAITVHKEKGGYNVEVYTMKYPPLQISEVLQPGEPSYRAYLYSVIALLIVAAGYVVYRKRKTKQIGTSTTPEHETANVSYTPAVDHKPVSAVFLFGDFQVFDKSGTDITSKFTTTLKELFTLIVLYSVKFENGISPSLLHEYLWPDKDETSARNNRNVNIKKLRGLLDEIGGITIENNNAYLRYIPDGTVQCDYEVVSKLLNDKQQAVLSDQLIRLLLTKVKRGSLLPNLQRAWLDGFKSAISNQVIDKLLEYINTLNWEKDDKIMLEVAEAIFLFDSINQEALMIKCGVLNKKGKYSLARTGYDLFVKEYKNLYDEDYPKTFEEVIAQH